MEIRRSRPVLAGVGFAALVLCIGSVSAAPEGGNSRPKYGKQGMDSGIARRIKPQALTKDQALDLQKKSTPEFTVPAFNIKRLDADQKSQVLGLPSPAALPGPLRYDARTYYHDDQNYMEILAYNGSSVGVRSLRNYLHFGGTAEVVANVYTRPSALIHFRAQANTRTLLECAVDATGPTNLYAADAVNQYSVHTADKSTLLYMRSQGNSTEDVTVQISGDVPGWYLDGCELTQVAI